MSLKEKLSNITQNAVEEKALIFSINVEEKLKEVAGKGENELLLSIDKEQVPVLSSKQFISMVHELLEGVNVEIIEKATNVLFPTLKTKFIRLSWD